MTAFDDLVARLTRRLRIDPELQMDIANELRAHLEDSAAEFRAAGYAEGEAEQKALAALGDEKELAASLWQANRRRIRIRQAIKWTCRVTLIPAAVVVVVAIVWGMGAGVEVLWLMNPNSVPPRVNVDRLASSLSGEQRLILLGDMSAPTRDLAQRAICDRWPDDPVFYANYAIAYCGEHGLHRGRSKEPDLSRLGGLLEMVDNGERVDPDNAFYNFMKAAILFEASTKLTDDPSRSYERPDWRSREREIKTIELQKLEVLGPELFQQGLREFSKGLSKPYYSDHVVEMSKIRLAQLPQPQRWSHLIQRKGIEISVLLPNLSSLRQTGRTVGAYAVDLAEQGRADAAIALTRDIVLMGSKIGADNSHLIGTLVGLGICTVGLDYRILAYKRLGQDQLAQQAQGDLQQEVEFFDNLRSRPDWSHDKSYFRSLGLVASIFMPSGLDTRTFDSGPMRMTEYSVADELMLVAMLSAAVLLAVWFGMLTGLSLLWHLRKPDGPRLLFVGWRRIGWICLWAILLPLAIYATLSYVPALSFRHYGLKFAGWPYVTESSVVLAAVLVLLVRFSYAAVRERAADAGMPVPPTSTAMRWISRILWGILLAAALVNVAVWRWADSAEWFGIPGMEFTAILMIVLFVFLVTNLCLVFIRIMRNGGKYAHFHRSFYRSAGPVLASAVIVIGMVCGLALARAETANVQRVQGNADYHFGRELDRSQFRQLRDRMAEDHARLLREYLANQPATEPVKR